jgi:hypothetical protein
LTQERSWLHGTVTSSASHLRQGVSVLERAAALVVPRMSRWFPGLVRAIARLDVLAQDTGRRFTLTEFGRLLTRDLSGSARSGALRIQAAGPSPIFSGVQGARHAPTAHVPG